jgi:hypothetical protein
MTTDQLFPETTPEQKAHDILQHCWSIIGGPWEGQIKHNWQRVQTEELALYMVRGIIRDNRINVFYHHIAPDRLVYWKQVLKILQDYDTRTDTAGDK